MIVVRPIAESPAGVLDGSMLVPGRNVFDFLHSDFMCLWNPGAANQASSVETILRVSRRLSTLVHCIDGDHRCKPWFKSCLAGVHLSAASKIDMCCRNADVLVAFDAWRSSSQIKQFSGWTSEDESRSFSEIFSIV